MWIVAESRGHASRAETHADNTLWTKADSIGTFRRQASCPFANHFQDKHRDGYIPVADGFVRR